MKLPDSAHADRPWRIHALAPDFRLEDVWRLPGTGEPEDFERAVERLTSADPEESPSTAIRGLFALRWRIGDLLGLDRPDDGLGSRVSMLRDRLPPDLLEAPAPRFEALPFEPLYMTEDEFAAEIANRTMHGVMHVGRVPDPAGGFRVQMAVLVKPNGLFGTGYMAAIKPFRLLIVYPAMIRQMEREVRAEASGVRQVAVPPEARARSTLPRIDYEDGWLVGSGAAADRPAEQSAREILEGAPAGTRSALLRAWCALGLKLGSPGAGGRVLGWEVRHSEPDLVLLGAPSRVGMPAELLLMRRERQLLFATFVQQQNPLARAVWALVAPKHRQVVQRMLVRAGL
jgi:Protein of unknown function (DUF2867)